MTGIKDSFYSEKTGAIIKNTQRQNVHCIYCTRVIPSNI